MSVQQVLSGEARSADTTGLPSHPVLGGALLAGAMVLFAAMAVLARLATPAMSAPQLVVVRFAVCAAGVLALAAAGQAEIRPRNLRLLVLRGVFGGIAVLLYFVALDRARDAGTAALLNNLSPIFTGLFAGWLLRERIGPRLVAGAILAFAGVTLVLRAPAGFLLGPGELAGIASAVFSGMAVTAIRASRASDNAATILLAFCVLGIAVALPFAIPAWHPADATVWGLAILVGLTSFAAQLMMTHAFGLVPAAQGAVYQQLTPVFTFGLGVLLLDERVTALAALGAALTLLGVGWAAVAGRR